MRFKWMLTLVLGCTFLTFAGTLRYQFGFDNVLQSVQNPRVQAWHFVPSHFTHHLWVHDPEYPLWSPGWHLLLVLWHLAAVATVCWLVRQWRLYLNPDLERHISEVEASLS